MAKNYNMTDSSISVNVPSIDKILTYPEPDYFTVNEKVFNLEVLQVLSKLDPTTPSYTKIDDCFDCDSITALKKLRKHYGKDGHIVNYAKKTNKAKKGRYYINNKKKDDTSCLQTTYKVVRRLLLNGQCVSIDMVNAHIEIVKNIARFLDIGDDDIKVLNNYCINRDKILEDIIISYTTTRQIAKQFFIIILYGGSLNTWIVDNNLISKSNCETEFMKDFIKSFEWIKSKIKNLDVFKSFCDIETILNKKKKTKYKKEISALAIFLQEIESKISVVIKNFCEENGCITRVFIHDGIVFDDVKQVCNQEFLSQIEEYIKDELDLIIPLDYENTNPTEDDRIWYNKHKTFLEENNINNDFNIIDSGNDYDAGMIVIKQNKGKYIHCQGELFVKEDNLWFSKLMDSHNFERVLRTDIIKANISITLMDGSYKSYSKCNTNQEKCMKQIISMGFESRDKFYDEILDSTKTYLPFQDCIYSFKEKKTYTYAEKPNIHFVQRINRDFPTRNEEHIKYVKDTILKPIFDNPEQLEYVLHSISRSMAGYVEDKKWFNWVGMRNCGKSVLTMFLCNTFEAFCKTFNADQLISNKFGNPDVARAMSWVIQHWFNRLLISNEIKESDNESSKKDDKIVLRGDLTKRLVSGGKDEIDCRADYGKKHFKIRPQFTMILCSNSTPEADPANALDTLEAILFKSKFVEKELMNPDFPCFKLKDISIEDDIRNIDYINAFMFIIFDHFKTKAVGNPQLPDGSVNPAYIPPKTERMKTPTLVLNDTKLSKGNVGVSIEEFLTANFSSKSVDTWDTKDNCHHTTTIRSILKHNGFNISTKLLSQKMDILCLGDYDSKNVNVDGKRAGGYKSLYMNPDILPED
uniref:SF3 helicase domain-containing protein n=1 Tax=viral metagenome TaxID=1070528 RepID=A0A6C0CIW2_9ZZZZ